MTDRRIKAVGTVGAINLGSMYRAGYEGPVADMSQTFTLFVKQAMAQLVPLYQNAGKAWSASNFVGPLSAHFATDVAAWAAHEPKGMRFSRDISLAYLPEFERRKPDNE